MEELISLWEIRKKTGLSYHAMNNRIAKLGIEIIPQMRDNDNRRVRNAIPVKDLERFIHYKRQITRNQPETREAAVSAKVENTRNATNENRRNGYYTTIQPYAELNSWQNRIVC